MKIKLLAILLILVSLSFSGCSKKNYALEEATKDLSLIKHTVQQYYLALEQGKYNEALNCVEYVNDNTKEDDELWLTKNEGQYSIEFSKRGNVVSHEYSPEAEQYRVITVIGVENKIDGQNKDINEAIYLKKIEGTYKIMHISSEDMKLNHRSSSRSTNWSEVYDKKKYNTIR